MLVWSEAWSAGGEKEEIAAVLRIHPEQVACPKARKLLRVMTEGTAVTQVTKGTKFGV
jgi:hypothetical protein